MQSCATVIVPFDDRVIFVSLLDCAEFSSRPSEVAQTLNAISGIQFLVSGRWLSETWLLGAICVRGRPGVGQGRLGSFMQFGCRLIGDMSHVRFFLCRRLEQRPSRRRFPLVSEALITISGSVVTRKLCCAPSGGKRTNSAVGWLQIRFKRFHNGNHVNPRLAFNLRFIGRHMCSFPHQSVIVTPAELPRTPGLPL